METETGRQSRRATDGETIIDLFDRLMDTGDQVQRARLVREAMLFLSARIDRNEELDAEQAEQIDRLTEQVQSLERTVTGLVELAEMAGQVTHNLLAGAPWRTVSNG